MPFAFETDQQSNPLFVSYHYKPEVCFLDPDQLPFVYSLTTSKPLVNEELALSVLSTKPRHQYDDAQDIYNGQLPSEHKQVELHLHQQLTSHLLEHALNAQVMYSLFYTDENGRLISPYSRSPIPFAQERLLDVLKETSEYLQVKFGTQPSIKDIEWIDIFLEQAAPLMYSPQFWQTRQGLELAELVGFRRMERLVNDAKKGDFIVLFSPYSSHRGTAIQYNVSMIGQISIEDGQKIVHMTYARNKMPLNEYGKLLNEISKGQLSEDSLSTPADYVSQPLLFTHCSRDSLLQGLHIWENKHLIDTYQKAVSLHKHEIDQLSILMSTGEITAGQLKARRLMLEQKLITTHRHLIDKYVQKNSLSESDLLFISNTQAGYGMGGLCGLAALATGIERLGMQDRYGDLTFECPHCHRQNIRPFGQLIEHCQHCGKGVRC